MNGAASRGSMEMTAYVWPNKRYRGTPYTPTHIYKAAQKKLTNDLFGAWAIPLLIVKIYTCAKRFVCQQPNQR